MISLKATDDESVARLVNSFVQRDEPSTAQLFATIIGKKLPFIARTSKAVMSTLGLGWVGRAFSQ
jgi:hypothetical protein